MNGNEWETVDLGLGSSAASTLKYSFFSIFKDYEK